MSLGEIKQYVLQLSLHERLNLASFIEMQTKLDVQTKKPRHDFSLEMAWLKTHRQAYRGQFVALKDGQLIAHGNDERVVSQAADAAGISTPFFAYLETEEEESFGGW